ncbi:hypothetical protein HOP50_05g40580 [Chloropicon primus]|uniref:Uncharacterized protein n=1 Tax=Chloropicon primus TaxID=1764295 RepID=A0A5B8MML6_9CHLO|nr:hypothetical protein A3770_05p40490 [Chloropicon primus]UPR00742.1 hypothetical protein HOP50_05g40580 [Chloropicon primus]|eukprot:QDZ21531.1 hypothetical protein A3770_05p40490 [Chloropicon primus]
MSCVVSLSVLLLLVALLAAGPAPVAADTALVLGFTSASHKQVDDDNGMTNSSESGHWKSSVGSGVIGGNAASSLNYAGLARTSFTKTGTAGFQNGNENNQGMALSGSLASTGLASSALTGSRTTMSRTGATTNGNTLNLFGGLSIGSGGDGMAADSLVGNVASTGAEEGLFGDDLGGVFGGLLGSNLGSDSDGATAEGSKSTEGAAAVDATYHTNLFSGGLVSSGAGFGQAESAEGSFAAFAGQSMQVQANNNLYAIFPSYMFTHPAPIIHNGGPGDYGRRLFA